MKDEPMIQDQDGGDDQVPVWEDLPYTEPAPPEDWLSRPRSFADETAPPQLIRTVNLLPIPKHDAGSADDIQGIANFILRRAKEGVGDIFAHEDYAQFNGPTEPWARAIAEHQTGIPYTMPIYFYDGPQKKVAEAIVGAGRYPLVGQCQQSVTTALCIGGWDGGRVGDVGSGIGALPYVTTIGTAWEQFPTSLDQWPAALWDQVQVGSCLFWSAPCPLTKDGKTCSGSQHVAGCGMGSGHVAMVIRKHPTDRKWQLWDTGTSFHDPEPKVGAQKGARMLWESHWWPWIAQTVSSTWTLRGIGLIHGLGKVRGGLKPRGRARLLLRRRSDKALLYRSEWISMEKEGLPIAWLLRSMRGTPFFESIEAQWCVNSAREVATPASPDNRPIMDCSSDARGNAHISWNPLQGLNDRADSRDWAPTEPFLYRPSAVSPATAPPEAPPAKPAPPEPAPAKLPSPKLPSPKLPSPKPAPAALAKPAPAKPAPPEPLRPESAPAKSTLLSAELRGNAYLQRVAAGEATIAWGANGASAKALQEALIAAGFPVSGGADGAFGAGTLEAVKALQTKLGIDATGVVNADTLKALDAKLAAARGQAPSAALDQKKPGV